MSKPSHIAYVVNKKDANDKGFWRPVGAVFAHRDGLGFELVIHDQLAVSGRIVCRPPKAFEPDVMPPAPPPGTYDDEVPF